MQFVFDHVCLNTNPGSIGLKVSFHWTCRLCIVNFFHPRLRRKIVSPWERGGNREIPVYCLMLQKSQTTTGWMGIKPCKSWDKLPTSTGFLAGFLNHQPYWMSGCGRSNRWTWSQVIPVDGQPGQLYTRLQQLEEEVRFADDSGRKRPTYKVGVVWNIENSRTFQINVVVNSFAFLLERFMLLLRLGIEIAPSFQPEAAQKMQLYFFCCKMLKQFEC